jgi:hypothetical protein
LKNLSIRQTTTASVVLALAALVFYTWHATLGARTTQNTTPVTSEVTAALESIKPEAIEAHIRFLADDLLEGRAPGQRGFEIASRYVETQFRTLGLEPAGIGGTFAQPVPLQESLVIDDRSSLTLVHDGVEKELAYGEDFLLSPNPTHTEVNISASLVFVGYGIVAPELDHNDYEGIDVTNKIVAYLNGAPDTFPNNQRAYYSSRSVKYEEAVSHGAVAVIAFTSPDDPRFRWQVSVNRSKRGSFNWLDENKNPNNSTGLHAIASLNHSGVEAVFKNSPVRPEEVFAAATAGKLRSFDLLSEATIRTTSRHRVIESANLVAYLEGSDPQLKNEYVVYVAHIDHFGIGVPVDGDEIYNGAHDNASGVSIMLEVARAYANLPQKPKRSVLFLAVTAEEWGLLGSDYFAHYPTVPRNQLVANFSMDMPFLFHPLLDIVPYGAEHSSLSESVGIAANHLGIKIGPDPIPQQVLFIRSDHFSFVRQGIPALFIKSGFETGDPNRDGSKINAEWRRKMYHTPHDEPDQAFDFTAGAGHARVNFLTGYLVANASDRPSWNENDFFGGKFSTNP